MPRKPKGGPAKCRWSEDNMKLALAAVQNGTGLRQTARRFNIPVSTLLERVKTGEYSKPKMGTKPVFTPAQEEEIIDGVLELTKLFYGLTALQLRRIVYFHAECLAVPHKFNKERQEAGKDFMTAFTRRHPRLCINRPEAAQMGMQGFSKAEVQNFFGTLTQLTAQLELTAPRIFNVDEIGFSTSQVLGPNGALVSGAPGDVVTACCCISASGVFVPPMLIHPGQVMDHPGPPGALYTATKTGRMTEDVFLTWVKHFAASTNAVREQPSVLILDNDASHVTLGVLEFCTSHGIHLVTVPPYTSHRFQPIDASFFPSLKKAHDDEIARLLKSEEAGKIVMADVCRVFTQVYTALAKSEVALRGFETTGVYPVDPSAVQDQDFYENSINNKLLEDDLNPS